MKIEIDKEYSAECDARTLQEAKEIKGDESRMKEVKKYLVKQKKKTIESLEDLKEYKKMKYEESDDDEESEE